MYSEDFDEQVAALNSAPETIAALIRDLFDEDLSRAPSDGTFSIVETMCHLRDLEIEGYTIRINRILNEAHPVLADFDGAKLAAERDYSSQDAREALLDFAEARRRNVFTLKSITPEQRELQGTLEGTGDVSLGRLIQMMCEHDEGHIEDVDRLCRLSQLTIEDPNRI